MKARRYTLRPAALRDLEQIWSYTAEVWSTVQAETYARKLFAAFDRLADNPAIARERGEYTPPVRIYRVEAHVIVYQTAGETVEIIRVRHGREDWMSDPDDA